MSNTPRAALCLLLTLLFCGAATAQTQTPGQLPKWTNSTGTLGDSVIAEQNGNIGIGTSAPKNKLHVVGAIELGNATPTGINPVISNPSLKVSQAQFQLYPGSGANASMALSLVPRGNGQYNNRAGLNLFNTDYTANQTDYEYLSLRARGNDFVLSTGSGGTGAIKPLMFSAGFLNDGVTNKGQLYLAANGRVGVGTTSPTEKLDVAGNVRANGVVESTTGGFKFPDGTVQLTAATPTTPGLSAVTPDATLVGDGTGATPLGLADGAVSAAKLSASAPQAGQVLFYDGAGLSWQTPSSGGPTAFRHTRTTKCGPFDEFSVVDHPLLNGKPNAMIIVTALIGINDTRTNTNSNQNLQVTYTGSMDFGTCPAERWLIRGGDTSDNAQFNVLVVP
jgi:hypothetical protein